jgi:hypothetical protein
MNNQKIFERFRDKLADEVLLYINNGGKIGTNGDDCRCPLGVLTVGSQYPGARFPNGAIARIVRRWVAETPKLAPSAFAAGFDGKIYNDNELQRYYQLGQAYRKKFVKEEQV